MKVEEKRILLWLLLSLLCAHLFSGLANDALSYDYTASLECLEKPHKPQYGGGIILNPELNHGLKGWSAFGGAEMENRASGGNTFIVAHSRKQMNDSISQKLHLHKDKLYTFSAWIQVSSGNTPVTAVFRTNSGPQYAGAVFAESGCWSMLKGGLTVDSSGPAELYFESEDTSVEIWVDSISLQPFTQEQWTSHQDQSIEKTRKRKVRLQATDAHGNPIAGAKMAIKQNKLNFPFGSAISKYILSNTAYQNWFTSRFTVTVFENELKWYSTEWSRGKEDYSVPDAMLRFAKQHGLAVRGHNILWDNGNNQPSWVPSLSNSELQAAVDKRINSVVRRYSGQFIGWDVVNENLHFSFFESRLGAKATGVAFQKTRQLDGRTTLFMNEYDTIEKSGKGSASPDKYLQKLREIQSFLRGGGNLGIGLEGHFRTPNIPYMRSAIDKLAAAKFPIWITELDVDPSQPMHLDQVLREAHAHPAIHGIVMWAAWKPEGCFRMCLTDSNFKNTPTGDVVDKLLQQWTHAGLVGTTDADGFFETSLFHGDYEVAITHPTVTNSSLIHSFKVASSTDISPESALLVKVSA
ncbi:endo-1,4-beta-xylanase 5 [Vitis vinifera]|nr:endo-1,4-beta-xylanase 5 [Vitis vinifera]|eukprot:XP_010647914.1 PREDICTED: uncharacterized protein LOC100248080 isoform X2 [Vitis vinifera]